MRFKCNTLRQLARINQVNTIIGPVYQVLRQTPALRRAAIICVALALVASAAEIAVALSLLPILASLGVDAGEELSGFVQQLPPFAWLVFFAIAAIVRSVANRQSAIQNERGFHELTVMLQTRIYRALAGAHWDAVRRISPPALTNALQIQTYLAGDSFSSLVYLLSATLLVAAMSSLLPSCFHLRCHSYWSSSSSCGGSISELPVVFSHMPRITPMRRRTFTLTTRIGSRSAVSLRSASMPANSPIALKRRAQSRPSLDRASVARRRSRASLTTLAPQSRFSSACQLRGGSRRRPPSSLSVCYCLSVSCLG